MCPVCERVFFVNTNPICDDCSKIADAMRGFDEELVEVKLEDVSDTWWVTVESYPNYEVCEEGIVRHKVTKKVLKPHLAKGDARRVSVNCSVRGYYTSKPVGRMVAIAFLKDFDPKYALVHIDGDPANLNVKNLKQGTKIVGGTKL